MVTAHWQPRQHRWDAQELFRDLKRCDVLLDDDRLESLRDYFWFDLCAEWDSVYLHEFLHKGGQEWSLEFQAFEKAWYEDELNHAEGFLSLYSVFYGEDREELRRRLRERKPDFKPVAGFLGSEFEVSLLFAYDEFATMRAYRLDWDLYQELGAPVFLDWLRHLLRDEAYHHKNGFDLTRMHHGGRLHEVPALIDRFVAFDRNNPPYRATFVFDHEWAHIDKSFFADTGELLKDLYRRSA